MQVSFFFVSLGTGCATFSPSASSGLKLLSKNAVRLELPFEAQTATNLCGIASLDMLTNYYQLPLKTNELEGLEDEARSTDGISGDSMKLALEEAGYFVKVFPGTLDHQESGLYHHIDLKRPLIVMTGTSPRHYCLAIGYDQDTAMIVLLDPALGQMAMPINSFMRDWKEANCFTLFAVPDQKDPGLKTK